MDAHAGQAGGHLLREKRLLLLLVMLLLMEVGCVGGGVCSNPCGSAGLPGVELAWLVQPAMLLA